MMTREERAHEKLGMYLAYQSQARQALRLAVEEPDGAAAVIALKLAKDAHEFATRALDAAAEALAEGE